jgi:hypothetical protein
VLLAAIRRVLHTDGMLVLSQPNYRGLVPLVCGARWYGWQPQQHWWHFDALALRRLLVRAGFRVVALEHNSMHHPWPAHWSLRWRADFRQVLIAAMAKAGSRLHMGDQMYVAARKTASACNETRTRWCSKTA